MSIASRYPQPAVRNRRGGQSWIDRRGRLVYGTVGLVGFALFWELGSRAGIISEFFFSRPTAVFLAGVNEVQLERFWTDVRVSLTEFLAGYGIAIAIGVPLGLLTGWYKRLNYALDPWLNFLNSLPRFALLPVIFIAFGLGIWSKIFVAFLGAWLAIMIPTIQGVRTVDRRFLDVAASFGASKARLFVTVVAPATVPFIITGLRLGVARALIGVITGELLAATEGLGFFIKRASDTLQTDRLLFAVLIFTFTGIILVEVLRQIEKRFQRWRPPVRRGAAA